MVIFLCTLLLAIALSVRKMLEIYHQPSSKRGREWLSCNVINGTCQWFYSLTSWPVALLKSKGLEFSSFFVTESSKDSLVTPCSCQEQTFWLVSLHEYPSYFSINCSNMCLHLFRFTHKSFLGFLLSGLILSWTESKEWEFSCCAYKMPGF